MHDRQVACRVGPSRPVIFKRSVLYNKFPADVVSVIIVSSFQRKLQAMLKTSAVNGVGNLHELFKVKCLCYPFSG